MGNLTLHPIVFTSDQFLSQVKVNNLQLLNLTGLNNCQFCVAKRLNVTSGTVPALINYNSG
jgi:hypothetical protein